MHKKLTKDQKQSTKQRIITGLIMAFYGVIIFIFFAFADPGIHIDIHNNEFMRFDQSRS
jgi:fructose-specific phosphotransferase system IIC component